MPVLCEDLKRFPTRDAAGVVLHAERVTPSAIMDLQVNHPLWTANELGESGSRVNMQDITSSNVSPCTPLPWCILFFRA